MSVQASATVINDFEAHADAEISCFNGEVHVVQILDELTRVGWLRDRKGDEEGFIPGTVLDWRNY